LSLFELRINGVVAASATGGFGQPNKGMQQTAGPNGRPGRS